MVLNGDIHFKCDGCNEIWYLRKEDIDPSISSFDHGENGMGDETIYEVDETIICPTCGQRIRIYISGNEYPQGVPDDTENAIEGGVYLEEPYFKMQYDESEPTERLLQTVINYCDEMYKESEQHHPCTYEHCTHDCKEHRMNVPCSCIKCLEEIHFHNGRRTYNCRNLVNCYCCRYLNKYVSEFSYALREIEFLKEIRDFRVISIGCGPAPDLMAFEEYKYEHGMTATLQYRGFDLNEYWKPIHRCIEAYCEAVPQIKARFIYEDAVDYFSHEEFPDANVLVLQYVISHFYNTNQFGKLHQFFENIADNIISKMMRPSVIIIHDINHCAFGRDQFSELIDILRSRGIRGLASKRYFDNNIVHPEQRYGYPYPSSELRYPPMPHIERKYCRGGNGHSNNNCSGASLILRLGDIE